MKGLYVGELILNNIQYSIQRSISSSAERIDFMYMEQGNSGGFYTMSPDNIKMMASIYIKGSDVYYYGDYNLYATYLNLINTIKYHYFQGDEIIKNAETVFDAEGIRQVTHHQTLDKNLEYYKEMFNGNVTELLYRCGNQELKLRLSKENVTVKMLAKFEYAQLDFGDNDTIIHSSSTYRSLNEIATFKDLSWYEERKENYRVVQTIEEFDEMVKELREAVDKGLAIGFDTETTGVTFNRHLHTRDELVGICITHKMKHGWYIPVGHTAINNLPLAYVLENLEYILTKGKLVTHYGKFDYAVMRSYGKNPLTGEWEKVDFTNGLGDYGLKINIEQDTFILLYLLSNIDSQNNLKLKNATVTYLGIDQVELSDIFPSGGENGGAVHFQILPYDIVRIYAPADADFTLTLYNLLKDKLPALTKSLYGHEVLFMKVLSEMEFFGNKIDIERMRVEARKCAEDINILEQQIYKMAGYVFNINSSPALSKLFYEDLKCEVITKTTSGVPSTGATALKNLSKKTLDKPVNVYTDICSLYKDNKGQQNVLVKGKTLNNAKYPIIHVIMKYKKLVKLHSTFFVGLERDNAGGWLFSSYNQTRALTGRTISNFQQIPGSLKHLIVPWSDDYYMINLDYKSIELYVMVGVAGQQEVIEQFSDPECDAHRVIGSQILKKPPQDISGGERKKMKVANFGVPFDMGPASLAQFLFGFPVTRENKEEAAKLKSDYLNSMPKVKRMFQETRDTAQTKGVVTTKFGRCGVFKNLVKETDPGLIARGRRQAGNLIIQGTAADILKIATNRLFVTFKNKNIDAHITGAIHDELILIVNKKHHPYEMIKIIKDCMELKIKDFPTIYTGISVSNDWGEGHGREILEMPQYLSQQIVEKVNRGQLDPYEGNPRDFILGEIRKYLKMRFEKYFDELGYNPNDIEGNNFYDLVNNFKHMYLGPRCVAYYTDFGGNEGEPEAIDAIKMALRDYTGLPMEKIEEYYKRDTPLGKGNDLEDIIVKFDLSELVVDEFYDLEEEDDVIEDVNDEDTNVTNIEEYRKSTLQTTRVITTYDSVVINLDGCTTDTVKLLTAYFNKHHTSDGFMEVMYHYHGNIINTNYRVDIVDRDHVLKVIEATSNSLGENVS